MESTEPEPMEVGEVFERLKVDQRKLVKASPQKRSQAWNLFERGNTLDSGRELCRVLCTAEKAVV